MPPKNALTPLDGQGQTSTAGTPKPSWVQSNAGGSGLFAFLAASTCAGVGELVWSGFGTPEGDVTPSGSHVMPHCVVTRLPRQKCRIKGVALIVPSNRGNCMAEVAQVMAITQAVVDQACEALQAHALRASDAIHLACALLSWCDTREV